MDFVYENLTEEMDDASFAFCTSKVYPLLDFKVIGQSDMRRIDLAEKMYKIDERLQDDYKRHKGSMDYYRYLLLQYLKNYARCREETRTYRYYERAVEMANEAPFDSGKAITQLKDILMIFLSIVRQHSSPKNWAKEIITGGVQFDLRMSDGDTLTMIHDQKELIPQGLIEGKAFFNSIIQERRSFFYFISILLLSLGLQDRGAFLEDNV